MHARTVVSISIVIALLQIGCLGDGEDLDSPADEQSSVGESRTIITAQARGRKTVTPIEANGEEDSSDLHAECEPWPDGCYVCVSWARGCCNEWVEDISTCQ